MLINFNIENYKSYKDAQAFTMVPGKYRSKKSHVISKKNTNILKFSSIYGGNASGKSNLVDAIGRTRSLIIKGSITNTNKELHFKLDNDKIVNPSNFEYKILVGSKIFIYGFSISFEKEMIISEYLYESKNNEETLYYDFDYKNSILEFNYKKIKNISNKRKIEVYQDDFKHKTNEIFLTYLNKIIFQDEEDWITDIKGVFQWFKTTLTILRPDTKPIDIVGLFDDNDSNQFISIIDLIKSFDTGITNFNKKELTLEEFIYKISSVIPKDQKEVIDSLFEDISNLEAGTNANIVIGDKYYKAFKKSEKIVIQSLRFEHCNINCAEFEFGEESDGTKRIIELVNLLYSVQFKNRVYIVDELNRSLHSNLTLDFIEKFIELSKNTESQLIVTNHDSALMDLDIVRQDEIWIVDRGSDGSSNLFSLSKYAVRSDKVLNKDYRLGRYGGIPQIYKLLPNKG